MYGEPPLLEPPRLADWSRCRACECADRGEQQQQQQQQQQQSLAGRVVACAVRVVRWSPFDRSFEVVVPEMTARRRHTNNSSTTQGADAPPPAAAAAAAAPVGVVLPGQALLRVQVPGARAFGSPRRRVPPPGRGGQLVAACHAHLRLQHAAPLRVPARRGDFAHRAAAAFAGARAAQRRAARGKCDEERG